MPRALALSALALAACADARPLVDDVRACATWKDDVAPVLQKRCVGCHGGADGGAKLDLASYGGALAAARSGDAGSPILKAIDPATADATHRGFGDVLPLLQKWVVECGVSYFHSSIHGGGILDPSNAAEFHGKVIVGLGWRLDACGKCHGADFSGGLGPSCRTCHTGEGGPTACTTCHGQPPASGAHAAHAGGGQARAFDCGECHVKPSAWDAVGHLFDADGGVLPAPEVTFGALAASTNAGGKRAAPPSFDPATARCDGVYCHGATLGEAATTAPTWTDSSTGKCGACHGLPPATHQNGRCSQCHPDVDATRAVADKGKHVDGVVAVGDGSATCTACHGGLAGPAPPRDLDGNTSHTAVGVGAHQAHLTAPHKLSAPIACVECHQVPAQLHDPGHIDSDWPAEVFPPVAGTGVLAHADGAQASFDHASASCSDVYCHGGGKKLGGDASPTVNRKPVWVADGPMVCGACHGVPPKDAAHATSRSLADCVGCHPKTIDGTGAIVWANGVTAHMNGVVDAQ